MTYKKRSIRPTLLEGGFYMARLKGKPGDDLQEDEEKILRNIDFEGTVSQVGRTRERIEKEKDLRAAKREERKPSELWEERMYSGSDAILRQHLLLTELYPMWVRVWCNRYSHAHEKRQIIANPVYLRAVDSDLRGNLPDTMTFSVSGWRPDTVLAESFGLAQLWDDAINQLELD